MPMWLAIFAKSPAAAYCLFLLSLLSVCQYVAGYLPPLTVQTMPSVVQALSCQRCPAKCISHVSHLE